MSREAMKLALEALKEYTCVVQSGTDPNKWGEIIDGGKPAREAIIALKQALEQPEPEPVAWAISFDGETPYKLWDGGDCALLDIEVKRHGGKTRKMPLYAAPPETAELLREIAELSANALDDYKMIQSLMAEREQEPVAWRNAAMRVGEDLCSVGPFGYYDMTAEQWLDWALSVVTVHAPPPKREPPCKTGSQCITKCMECAEPEPVIDKSAAIRIATSLGWTPQREPLTPQSPCEMTQAEYKMFKLGWLECEAAHGIRGKHD